MKIATIGTGFIVDDFLDALNQMDGAQCVAMYSRKEETATPLAEKYAIPSIFTNLEEMLSQPEIDTVYVASPNSLHYEHTYQALKNGKNVICEKPFTSTLSECESLIRLAKQNNLFLFEAIKTIHLPNYKLIKDLMEKIGPVKLIQCNYSQYSSRYDKLKSGETTNVFNLDFSGGALADINIYNVHFVIHLLGIPEEMHYKANRHENGIDTSGVAVMKYPHFIAECVGSKDSRGMNFIFIQGEKGYIHVENGPNSCQRIVLTTQEEELTFNQQKERNLIYYELSAFYEIFKSKDYDRCYSLLNHTHSVMHVYQQLRKSAGIVFKADL